MAVSITAKLLLASLQSYQIKTDGPVPAGPNSDQIGYLDQPQGFASGAERIDAALVGETADGIIVAFRGTLPPDSPNHRQALLDWLNDCDAELVTDNGGELPGKVHEGFLGALDALWPQVRAEIERRRQANPTKPIYVTGHSKGGAMANLAALRLRQKLAPETPVLVATFAAARAGDADFAKAYTDAIPHSSRYEYADDIVPHLPPSERALTALVEVPGIGDALNQLTRGYVSVGDLHFINWDGKIVEDSFALRLERLARLAKLLTSFGFAEIIADHSILPGSGYYNAINPG